jgi:sugar-specific transcriptional regulator TrmB
MTPDVSAIRTYFAKLGLEREIADMYLALHTHGPQSISELARSSKVERTRIYRLIDKLLESNLIEVETHYKRGIIKAAPIANLRILITQREQDLQGLQDELELIEQVLARNSLSSPATSVQFYRGPEGIRQMLWNELSAKSDVLAYAYRILDEVTGKKFMERWAEEFERRKLQERLLVNDEFFKSWQENKPGIDLQRRIKGIAYNFVPFSTFKITHSSSIYDDVVAYFHWKENEVFGVEVHNKEIAQAQRQLLEMVWAQSKPETRF